MKYTRFVLSVIGCSLTVAAAAVTCSVDPVNGVDAAGAAKYKTLTYALAQHGGDTTYSLAAGTYGAATGETFPITLSGLANVTLTGVGGQAIFDASGSGTRVMVVSASTGVVFENLTITGGDPTASQSSLDGAGSAIYMSGTGDLTLSNCKITRNTRHCNKSYGVVYCPDKFAFSATGCEFSFNECASGEGYGDAFAILGSGTAASLTDCVFAFNGRNGCNAYGSAIYNRRANTQFTNCLLRGNYGRSIVHSDGGHAVKFTGCTIAHNAQLVVSSHTYGCVSMENSIVWGNGHVFGYRSGTLTNCVLQDGFGGMASTDPEFYDGYHVPSTNPAYGLGYQYPSSAPAPVARSVYYVNPEKGSDANAGTSDAAPLKTLTAALAKGASAEIRLAAGRYDTASGEIFPIAVGDKLHLALVGAGRDATVIDAADAEKTVFSVTNSFDLVFSNLTVTGGYNLQNATVSEAGGIAFSRCSEILVDGCDISGNSAGYTQSAQNWAYGAGLSALYCGDLDLSNLSVTNNRILQVNNGQCAGIGLCFASSYGITLGNCEVLDNAATSCSRDIYGGGICFYASAYIDGFNLLVARKSAVLGSKSGAYGAGICGWSGSSFNLRCCTIADNTGTGLYQYQGTMTVADSIISGNTTEIGYSNGARYWTNCCTSAALSGTVVTGQVTDDPGFVGTTYFVKSTSPVVNAGSANASDFAFGARTLLADGSADTGVLDIGYHAVWTGPIDAVTDLYVSPSGDDEKSGRTEDVPVRTLTQALKLAEKGTVFHIKAGTYDTAAGEEFPLDLSNTKALSLIGETGVILDASGSGARVITATGASGLLLKGLAITGGYASGSTESVSGCCGGGVYAANAVVTFEDCVIEKNYVKASSMNPFGGGVYASGSSAKLTFVNCEIAYNDTNGDAKAPVGVGICLRSDASASLTDSVVHHNSAGGRNTQGGAFSVWTGNSKLTLENCLVYGNNAAKGAFLYTEGAPSVTITGSTIARNPGQLYIGKSTGVTVADSIVWGNGGAFTPKSASNSVIQGGFGGATDVDPVFTNGYRVASAVVAEMNCGYDYGSAAVGSHASYFVSPEGSDAAAGDEGHPFRSLTAALAKKGPKTIHVAAGTYDSSVETFPLVLRDVEGVKIVGEGPNETVFSAAGVSKEVFAVSNALGLVLSGIGVTGGDHAPTAGAILASGLPIRDSSEVLVTNCAIYANRGSHGTGGGHTYGIGVSACYCGGVTLDDCAISDNVQYGSIGNIGVFGIGFGVLESGDVRVRNCEFRGNKAEGLCGYRMRGSAICAVGTANISSANVLDVFNALVAKNSSVDSGGNAGYGAVTLYNNCTLTVRNSTVADNGGPGVYRENGTLSVTDSILYGNGDDVGGTSVTLSYCDVGDGDAGTGCFSEDPGFVGTTYLVPATSSVIDKGSATASSFGLGEPWGVRSDAVCDTGVVDLGYHQRDVVPPEVITDLYVSPTGSDANKGTSADKPLRTLTKAFAKAEANVTIHVKGGTYDKATGETFPLAISGINGVSVRAEDGRVILDAAETTNRVLTLSTANRATFVGMDFVNGWARGGNGDGYGGGVSILQSTDVGFYDCRICNNLADFNANDYAYSCGGGLYALGASGVFSNCVFRGNATAVSMGANPRTFGGGICVDGGSDLAFYATKIVSNTLCNAGFCCMGAAISTARSSSSSANVRLRNCLIEGNVSGNAEARATAVSQCKGTMTVENCTFVGNTQCAIHNMNEERTKIGTVSIVNSIIYGNGIETNGTLTVSHTLIGGCEGDAENHVISGDPRFRKPAAGDYRLRGASPCVDTGLNADWMKTSVDLNGEARIRRGTVDMGAYECQTGGLKLIVR